MRAVLFSTALILAPATAFAGDAANRTLLGFSPDGALFAFMESGVQDGSGFPYANVYLVDVASDAWAEPPVQVMLRDDGAVAEEGQAVRAAAEQAAPLLLRHDIFTPGRHLWSAPLAESSGDDPVEHGAWPASVAARFTNDRSGPFTLKLDEIDMPDGQCADYQADVQGFTLTLETIGVSQVIYTDTEIPESRGCALGYSLSDILESPADSDGGRSLIVLVNVFRHGFEGWDRRFLAVPFAAPAEQAAPR